MRALFVFISFVLLRPCEAQQHNTWYFGDGAGISFNAGGATIPYTLTDGVNSAHEGNAGISDSNGNLLFYTNGKTVYNRTHQVMLNGDNLLGNTYLNAVQGALIVPLPNSRSMYYIFTTDCYCNGHIDFSNGYRYAVVDMEKDGGKGAVVTKDVLLYGSSTERLTAARHANGIDVWIITNQRSSNTFKAYLLTCTGLQATPVTSVTGRALNENYDIGSIGMMKVSPDGSQLCETLNTNYPGNFFQLFDFNNATGVLSNAREISNPGSKYYGCEFSPDSKLLYLPLQPPPRSETTFIEQFESKLGSAAAINASRVLIPTIGQFAGIQTGPDGKIYLNSTSTRLSVISHPNIKGTGCTFEADKIDLGITKKGRFGLPAAVNDWPFDPYNYFTAQVIDSCRGIIQFNGQTAVTGAVQWSWDFGDGTTSSLPNPQHTFSPYNQPYNVKLTITSPTACGYIDRNKTVFPRGTFIKAGFDTLIRCDSGYVRFINTSTILPDTGAVYNSWDFGDGHTSAQKDPVHRYTGSGIYTVKMKMTAATQCIADSISKTIALQQLHIQAPPDQIIEPGQSVQLFVTGGGAGFQWSPPLWLSDPSVANPVATPQNDIRYVVTVTNDNGCNAVDSVMIKINQVPGIYVPSAFTPNGDGLNDVFRPVLRGGYTLKNFTIFNRWGQMVFSAGGADKGWDGTINGVVQNTGIYTWIMMAMDAQGKEIQKRGTVTLMR